MDEKVVLLEQYKLYVEMADRVSQRRAESNRFYMTILSSILVVLSIVIEKQIFSEYQLIMFALISILGLMLSLIWYANIRSYSQLNSGKFAVINDMEKGLPYMCFKKEWELLGEGLEAKKYRQLTRVEKYVPIIIAIPYVLLLIFSVVQWL